MLEHRLHNLHAKAQAHINAGSKKVVISAPAGKDLLTIVYNVNYEQLTIDNIISMFPHDEPSSPQMAGRPNDSALHRPGSIKTTIHAFTGTRCCSTARSARATSVAPRLLREHRPEHHGRRRRRHLVLPSFNGKPSVPPSAS